MTKQTDILIIGAGIIGNAIAYYLSKAGADVMVLEKGEIGQQASSAAAGLLAPLGPLSGPGPFADLLLTSFSLFPSLVPELESLSGLPLAYQQTGTLRTVRNPKRISALKKRLEAWRPLGLSMHWLTGDEARQQEPLLSPAICAAISAPEEAQIQAPALTQAFAIAASKQGVTFSPQTEAINITSNGSKVTGVQTNQGEIITCQHLILATGSWAAKNAKWLHLDLPLTPLKGQIFSQHKGIFDLKHIIFGESVYIIPKQDTIVVGATKEHAAFDTRPTEKGISWLRETATRLMPTIQERASVSAWAGLRPGTPDKRPILGPAPHWTNVTLAVGHNSVGIILSAITGQTVAEAVITGCTPEIIRPFSFERFTLPTNNLLQGL